MYGWRARIGLLIPMDNAVIEPELYSLGLRGVSLHFIRLDTTERTAMPGAGVRLARGFVEMGADVIAYCCAETAFLNGTEGNAWIASEITRSTGLPATTAMSAKVAAVHALGASRIALVTPYTPAREQIMVDFWARHDVAVVSAMSRDFNAGVGDPREWYVTNLQPPQTAYRMARAASQAAGRAASRSAAQAMVISATNFRTFDLLAQLERDLGLPVVTSNQAILWHTLHLLGLGDTPGVPGRLMQVAPPWEGSVP